MKTETHRLLAFWLVNRFLADSPAICRAAFYTGCMEPDYILPSYLHGFFVRPFYGHDYENRRRWLQKRLRNKKFTGSPYGCFKLGRLVHFLCDAFTHVHNYPFHGGIRSHGEYERRLNQCMKEYLDRGDFRDAGLSDMQDLETLHKRYMSKEASPERDCRFIVPAVSSVIKTAAESSRCLSKIRPQGLKTAENGTGD